MFTKTPDFSVTFPSQTKLLKMAVDLTLHITTLSQFSPADAQKVALAIDEAVTNVIIHSYQNQSDKEITIEYYLNADGIKIKIIYAGLPPILVDEEINLKKMIKNKRKGGLGVRIMKKIMDSVEYKTVNGVNSCEMIKWQKTV